MKAIDFAQGLKKKLTNNLAPISKGEINLLVDMLEKERAKKPTVVIHLEGGLITEIAATCELDVIKVDYDIEGHTGLGIYQVVETPSGDDAFVDHYGVDVYDDLSEWVTLANQE